MGLTALQERAEGLGAAGTAEYRGATVATRFSSPEQELVALRSGCGVYDLGYRSKISLTGSDRVRWLNGMVTNNIRDLAARRGVYAFLLNPQGRILADLYAYNRGDSITMDTDRSQIEKILATFDHFIIMDDVEVTNLSDQWTTLGLAGPRSREVARAAGIEIPATVPLEIFDARCCCDCDCTKCTTVRGEDADHESYELWLAPGDVRKTWDALVAHGATPVGSETLELQRILAGIPLYGIDIRERDLPQETEQARALNFNKGCYVGQEIVERIRSRGAVHRKFAAFLLEGTPEVASGAKITSGEKEVGEITSVAWIPGAAKTVALGYIRREIGTPGREVTIGTSQARVVQAPVFDLLSTSEPASEEKLPA
ncbi:MAG TPA: glycine cleavage T C-terminal barrel domain-containing protein [Candidatus Sulfotelmatobacter sp.]|nr:glycine cleavage T C-terminal barrel domain-containing protein [Candidatus Sulfotelmatobacter sp.]